MQGRRSHVPRGAIGRTLGHLVAALEQYFGDGPRRGSRGTSIEALSVSSVTRRGKSMSTWSPGFTSTSTTGHVAEIADYREINMIDAGSQHCLEQRAGAPFPPSVCAQEKGS